VLEAHIDLEWSDSATEVQALSLSVADARAVEHVTPLTRLVTIRVEPDDVEPWWPRGHGDQPLYDLTVTIHGDAWSAAIGFRTVSLDTTPDDSGVPFVIRVNGEPIFVKGANWIPGDALITRMTPDRYRTAVTEAAAANMNLLRVWGGGMYESDDFYEVCNELGIVVWQDFAFACAAYSEEDPLRGEIEAEAREAVTRLSKHPSLALWNGCNENIWAYVEWGWAKNLVGLTWGNGYYRDLLPAVVAELDPTRPYSPGSPFSFLDYAHPNDDRFGTMHIWDVWNQVDYTGYASHDPRFASEFGFQGPPAWSTLVDVVHDDPLTPDGEQMLVHQKAEDGNLKLSRGLGEHLPVPRTIEQWHWATQLNQARAVTFALAHFRARFPHNSGAIVWQLNDNWPVISWSAIDFHGHRKPLWYALRASFADRLLLVRADASGALQIVAHNDTDETWEGSAVVHRRVVDMADPVESFEVALRIAPRSLLRQDLPASWATTTNSRREYLSARFDAATAHHWFAEDPHVALAPTRDAVDVRIEATPHGFDAVVTATSVVKDLFVQADRIHPDARAHEGLITLDPGQSARIAVSTPPGSPRPTPDSLGFPVLCSAGDLTHLAASD
jgi:beta-mannosidase